MMFDHGDVINKRLSVNMNRWIRNITFCLALVALPAISEASQINNVSLTASASGDVVKIEADAALEYQVFDLDGPARVVLNFPGASISGTVKDINPNGSGVTGVFPSKNKDGARIEIGLSQTTGYNIEESGNNLIIRFSKVSTESDGKAAASIQGIEVRESGAMTELVLNGSNMDANHNAFLSNKNQTLILDFWGATSKLPKEHYQYASQWIRDVTVGQADGRVRLVAALLPSDKLTQQIDATSNQMIIRLGKVEPKRFSESITVENVTFQPDDRIAHVMIRTDEVNPIVNINEKGGNVIIDMKHARLAAGMERSQDVSAFPGPVKQIDSYGVNGGVRVVARLRGKVDVTSFQQGNVVTINFEPEDLYAARKSGGETGPKTSYVGQNVSFDFKDIEITNALKLLSEMSDLNIIMASDVRGTLTMRLVDVPWDQALDLILTSQGLGKQVDGNVMRIAPLDVLRREHKEELEGQKDVAMIEPLITEPISLNFARVEEIQKMLEQSKQKATENNAGGNTAAVTSSASILSPRGSYLVDQRTNTLIVTDTQQAINNVKRFISIVDKSVEQVLIEARIVEATSTFTQEFGIRWGGLYQGTTAQNFPNTVDIGAAGGSGAANGMIVDLPSINARTNGGAIGISLGSFSNIINLDLELSAAEVDGTAKIVSSPRVLTSNGGKAMISQGFDVPYITPATASTPATVQFKKAELKLDVSPQITANKTVIMEVDITKDAPTGQSVLGNPILATKKVTTNLQVKDGETIVIGGIFTKDGSKNESGVPGIKDIPLLGWLFKTKDKSDTKTELLIFLTPKIINDAGRSEARENKI